MASQEHNKLAPLPSPHVQLTFRVVAGFKDVQLVRIVCEGENFNHRVQDNHNSETEHKFCDSGWDTNIPSDLQRLSSDLTATFSLPSPTSSQPCSSQATISTAKHFYPAPPPTHTQAPAVHSCSCSRVCCNWLHTPPYLENQQEPQENISLH